MVVALYVLYGSCVVDGAGGKLSQNEVFGKVAETRLRMLKSCSLS